MDLIMQMGVDVAHQLLHPSLQMRVDIWDTAFACKLRSLQAQLPRDICKVN